MRLGRAGRGSDIQDRRAGGFPGGAGGMVGGGAGIIGLLVVLATQCLGGGGGGSVLGANPFDAFNQLDAGVDQGVDPGTDAGGQLACGTTASAQDIVCAATTDVQDFWTTQFREAEQEYTRTQTVFFRGQTGTGGCGPASSQVGPFYCPADSLVYIDLDFLDALQDQLDAEGDFAKAYIIAHEYGHHVQNVLGISSEVREAQQSDPSRANEYSIRLELQADCLAGNWARDAEDRGVFILTDADIDNALNAAGAVGDDRIQAGAGGGVNPETWTHGSAEDRQNWFRRGLETGNPDDCNTFTDDAPIESV